MAYFGLSTPVIAKLDTAKNTYSEGLVLSKLIGTNITPQYAEGSLYCDNALGYHEKVFKEGDISLETDSVPLKAGELLFGHTVDNTSTHSEISKTDDTPNYVGYGFIGTERLSDGTQKFIACWLPKCQFVENGEDIKTRGDSITFGTHKLSGKCFGNHGKIWRKKQQFDTEAAALEFLKKEANIVGEP